MPSAVKATQIKNNSLNNDEQTKTRVRSGKKFVL